MTERVPPQRRVLQFSVIVLVITLLLNVLVYFVADDYYRSRAGSSGAVPADLLWKTRAAFALFSGLTGLVAVAAVWSPRVIGHGIPALAVLASFAAGIAAARADYHPVLPASLIVIAVVLVELIRSSLKGSRAGWAFLASMCGVLATVTLFGSTKVRNALDIGLWHAMLIPGVLAGATAALILASDRYRDPGPAR